MKQRGAVVSYFSLGENSSLRISKNSGFTHQYKLNARPFWASPFFPPQQLCLIHLCKNRSELSGLEPCIVFSMAMNQTSFQRLVRGHPALACRSIWVSEDVRPERKGKMWLNAIFATSHNERSGFSCGYPGRQLNLASPFRFTRPAYFHRSPRFMTYCANR